MTIRNLERTVNHMTPGSARAELGTRIKNLEAVVAQMYLQNAHVLVAPTLAIKAAESPTAKSVGAFSVLVAGTRVAKSADTDMGALVGTLATAKWAAWAFEIGTNGTPTVATKTADSASEIAAVAALPAVTINTARLGYLVIGNASGVDFVGGTTALDATGITAKFVNAVAAPAFTPDAMV